MNIKQLLIGFGIFLIILSGFIGYDIKGCEECKKCQECKDCDEYKKDIDGLYLGNWNETRVKDYTKEIDPRGDWVCVNVRDMSYKRCVEVVQHECGHEIWAEICEKDNELCNKGQELLNNYSRENEN